MSRETESAFRAVKSLSPFAFTIVFGGLEKNKNQERLNSWLALRKD